MTSNFRGEMDAPLWRGSLGRTYLRLFSAAKLGGAAYRPLGGRALPRVFRGHVDICLGWQRPFAVAVTLIAAAALLEALQGLTPTHSANLLGVLTAAAGALAAALLAKFII